MVKHLIWHTLRQPAVVRDQEFCLHQRGGVLYISHMLTINLFLKWKKCLCEHVSMTEGWVFAPGLKHYFCAWVHGKTLKWKQASSTWLDLVGSACASYVTKRVPCEFPISLLKFNLFPNGKMSLHDRKMGFCYISAVLITQIQFISIDRCTNKTLGFLYLSPSQMKSSTRSGNGKCQPTMHR